MKKNEKNRTQSESEEVRASDDSETEQIAEEKISFESVFEALTKELESAKTRAEVAETIAAKERQRGAEITSFSDRLQSDFDNYRKRTQESVKNAEVEGVNKVLQKILPLLDVFTEAKKMITDQAVLQGVEMIERNFVEVLASFGVTEIDALGAVFDPNLHDCVFQSERQEGQKANEIVQVFSKGYVKGDRVLRHSVVRIVT